MDKIAFLKCSKCGAQIPVDDRSVESHEDGGILFVRYNPAHTKVVLINAESGSRHTVDLLGWKQPAKPAWRQIGGIIGPY